jgi:hypothetical protein
VPANPLPAAEIANWEKQGDSAMRDCTRRGDVVLDINPLRALCSSPVNAKKWNNSRAERF